MHVLVLNSGSSSLKLGLFSVEHDGPPRRAVAGLIQQIGQPGLQAEFAMKRVDAQDSWEGPLAAAVPDQRAATVLALNWLRENGLMDEVVAVGHRIVHGGTAFTEPVVIDSDVLTKLEDLVVLAPLHNGPALEVVRATIAATTTQVLHIACFDTAFHSSMPDRASLYAVDPELAERYGIRRYGFHGHAHRSMLERYSTHSGRPPEVLRLVTLQLGNGCSAAAISGGRSIDTTMGLTPLEGLVMGTRCGDVDAAIVGHLMREGNMRIDQVEHVLNRRSGLLGVSGLSGDMRDLLAAEAAGDDRAAQAIDQFCYRARKVIGAYLAALGGADALIFGGGIGVHAPAIRERICASLEWTGIRIDPRRNQSLGEDRLEGVLSDAGARPEVYVASTDEESAIARDVAAKAAAVYA